MHYLLKTLLDRLIAWCWPPEPPSEILDPLLDQPEASYLACIDIPEALQDWLRQRSAIVTFTDQAGLIVFPQGGYDWEDDRVELGTLTTILCDHGIGQLRLIDRWQSSKVECRKNSGPRPYKVDIFTYSRNYGEAKA